MPVEMICQNCQQPFYCYQNEVERGRRFCSLQCRSAFRFNRELKPASLTPVEFSCQECGKPFTMMQSYLTAYRKKFGHDPFYCSAHCSGAGRRRRAEETHNFVCLNCGKAQAMRRKPGGRLYREQKFCDQACKNEYQAKQAAERFSAGEIGRHVKQNGYIWLSLPALVSNTGKRREMLEHRYVMEQHLGRPLDAGETIHHRDGDRTNNTLANLELRVGNHGPGQEVHDVVAWSIRMLKRYSDFAVAQGFRLIEVEKSHDPLDAP